MSVSSSRVGLLLALVAISTLACKAASKGPSSPDAAAGEAYEPEQAEQADPLAELDRLEQQMRQLGLPVAGDGAVAQPGADASLEAERGFAGEGEALTEDDAGPAEPTAAAPRDESRREQRQVCETICDVSVAICDLEQRICSLAESHAGERVYAEACRRASDDCEVAGYECDRCGDR